MLHTLVRQWGALDLNAAGPCWHRPVEFLRKHRAPMVLHHSPFTRLSKLRHVDRAAVRVRERKDPFRSCVIRLPVAPHGCQPR